MTGRTLAGPVLDAADLDAVRALCRDFVAWMRGAYPEHAPAIDAYFTQDRWEARLAALPDIHARPAGGILLARSGGRPVGCIMWKPLGSRAAEVKRLFVRPEARRLGTGRALVETAIRCATADGLTELRLETAGFLTDAQRLFAACGFRAAPARFAPGVEVRGANRHMIRHL